MKLSAKKLIQIVIVSIALFILGQLVFIRLFGFFEPNVDGILFQVTEMNKKMKTSILFSLTLVFIPLLIILTWRLAPIISITKKIASALSILVFIIAAIFLRHQEVKTFFIKVVKPIVLVNNKTNVIYPIDPVNFVYYMLAGLCVGCLVSYFLFRQNKIYRSPN
jgi:hypothetical protein